MIGDAPAAGMVQLRLTLSGLREPVSAGLAGNALGGGGSNAANILFPVTCRAMYPRLLNVPGPPLTQESTQPSA